jgi:cephalosporin hydroxylase/GT2 family glycosyltransferase
MSDDLEVGEVRIPHTSVYMLNVNPGEVAAPFADSLMSLVGIDKIKGWDLFAGKLGWVSGVNVAPSRNTLVRKFLETDAEWAWFCDSDMVFPPDSIIRLLLAAQQVNTKVVGGLCVMIPQDGTGPIPTIYQYNTQGGAGCTQVQLDYQENAMIQVAATGAAFFMVHREVLEAMRDKASKDRTWLIDNLNNPIVDDLIKRGLVSEPHPDHCWFHESVRRERWVSEDIEFFLRVNELGYSVWVDTRLQIGHYKDRRTYWPADIKNRKGFRTPEIVAIVPVKDNLPMTSSIVEQLREQKCDEIVICDNGSRKETWDWLQEQDDITVLDCQSIGINEMWNRGVEHCLTKYNHRFHAAFLNNDLNLGADCLKLMSRELLDRHPEFVAMSANYDNRSITDQLVEETTDICANRYDGTGGLAGFAFMVSGELFSSGYRFPSVCHWWYGDNDLMQYLNFTRKKAGIVLAAKVEHIGGGGQTGHWEDPKWAPIIEADRQAFENRWKQFYLTVDAMNRQADHTCDPRALEVVAGQEAQADRLPFICDLDASAKAFPRQWSNDIPFMVKIKEDVERYEKIIQETKPEVIVEAGTWDGGSAEWFANQGLEVITIDTEDHVPATRKARYNGQITWLRGNSVEEGIVETVKELVGDKRCMVSLDSDHHACHVAAEMELYSDLVSDGCYMVVEDGLVRWVPGEQHQTIVQHGPMEAIEHYLAHNSDFERDEALEKLYPATMHPAGWLRKAQQ